MSDDAKSTYPKGIEKECAYYSQLLKYKKSYATGWLLGGLSFFVGGVSLFFLPIDTDSWFSNVLVMIIAMDITIIQQKDEERTRKICYYLVMGITGVFALLPSLAALFQAFIVNDGMIICNGFPWLSCKTYIVAMAFAVLFICAIAYVISASSNHRFKKQAEGNCKRMEEAI